MSNLLAQRKEIKRLEKEMERRRLEDEEQIMREEEEARIRAVEDFDRVQMGLDAKVGAGMQIVRREAGTVTVEDDVADGRAGSPRGKRGQKRKFELDEAELLRIAKEQRMKARKALDDEKVCSAHVTLLLILERFLTIVLRRAHQLNPYRHSGSPPRHPPPTITP